MPINSEDIINKILLRTDQIGLSSANSHKLIASYLDSVCMEIAAKQWLRDLLKEVYVTSDEDGTYIFQEEVIPFLVFAYGQKGVDHSWQRVSPVDYEYFESWKSRVFRGQYVSGGAGAFGGIRRRYSILPQLESDTTRLQILEKTGALPLKIVYYPIRPDVSEFPSYFEPLITNKVLELLAMDKEQSNSDRYFTQLAKRTKELFKLSEKQGSRLEIKYFDKTSRNKKTDSWLESESNDVSFWIV